MSVYHKIGQVKTLKLYEVRHITKTDCITLIFSGFNSVAPHQTCYNVSGLIGISHTFVVEGSQTIAHMEM